MKVLTAAQIRRIDQQTIDAGFPGLLLMENAGHRVMEALETLGAEVPSNTSHPAPRPLTQEPGSRPLRPLERERVVIFCGKGNNGGDGLVVARHLLTRRKPASLHVLLTAPPEELSPDARANLKMFEAAGGRIAREITPDMQPATLLIDAMLGTGLDGAAREPVLGFIQEWNKGFPLARRIAIDVPSGMSSDALSTGGEFCHVDGCVTFTALRPCHVLPPLCDFCGEVLVGQIGTPERMLQTDPDFRLSMISPAMLRFLSQPRERSSHKGDYGHVLIVGGSRSKSGAVGMAGLAALRTGAGLVTVATVSSAVQGVLHIAPELMSAPLAETADGFVESTAFDGPLGDEVIGGKTVVAVGPGLGVVEDTRRMLVSLLASVPATLVLDADALNILALESQWPGDGRLVLTPHPGEMARLMKTTTADIQANRLARARDLAVHRNATVILKGQRTIVAFPDGEVWINPTGSPAMATAGTGDVLCGTVASMLAQHPNQPKLAVGAAVYIHGLAGDFGSQKIGEPSLIATDLLRFYPQAFAQFAQQQTSAQFAEQKAQ